MIEKCLFNLSLFPVIYWLIDFPTEPEGGSQSIVSHHSSVTAAVTGISKVFATDVNTTTPKYKTTQSEQMYLMDRSTGALVLHRKLYGTLIRLISCIWWIPVYF